MRSILTTILFAVSASSFAQVPLKDQKLPPDQLRALQNERDRAARQASDLFQCSDIGGKQKATNPIEAATKSRAACEGCMVARGQNPELCSQ